MNSNEVDSFQLKFDPENVSILMDFLFVFLYSSVADCGGGWGSVAGGVCHLRGLRAPAATHLVRYALRDPDGSRPHPGRLFPTDGPAQPRLASDYR